MRPRHLPSPMNAAAASHARQPSLQGSGRKSRPAGSLVLATATPLLLLRLWRPLRAPPPPEASHGPSRTGYFGTCIPYIQPKPLLLVHICRLQPPRAPSCPPRQHQPTSAHPSRLSSPPPHSLWHSQATLDRSDHVDSVTVFPQQTPHTSDRLASSLLRLRRFAAKHEVQLGRHGCHVLLQFLHS